MPKGCIRRLLTVYVAAVQLERASVVSVPRPRTSVGPVEKEEK